MDSGEYERELKNQGYREIGRGSFGVVYHKSGENTVIKVGRRFETDRALNYAYLAFAMQHKSQHVPKVHYVATYNRDSEDAFYTVKMEYLQPFCNVSDDQEKLREILQDSLCDRRVNLNVPDSFRLIMRHIIALLKNLDAGVDLHTGNVMLRGDTLVITDPIC